MFICMYFTGSFVVFATPLLIFSANIDPGHLVICFNILGHPEAQARKHHPSPGHTRVRGPPTSCPSWEASLIRGKLPAWTKSKRRVKAARRWL